MRKRLIIIFVGIVIFIFVLSNYQGCEFIEKLYKIRSVKARVHTVLQGIQLREDGRGTVGDEQLAVCRWYADSAVIGNLETLNIASDEFDAWRKGANFHITDYTITDVEIEESRVIEQVAEGQDDEEKSKQARPWVFIVSGRIDGATYIMRVPEGDTISWISSPWI